MTNFAEQYFGNWDTERDRKLHELATRYHAECEAYDQVVYTGPLRNGLAMPATHQELVLSWRHANRVQDGIIAEAVRCGLEPMEVLRSISMWSPP